MWQLGQAGRDVVGMGLIVKALILNDRCNDSTRLWSVWAELRPTRARVQLFLIRTAVFTVPRLVLDCFCALLGPWCGEKAKPKALLWRLAYESKRCLKMQCHILESKVWRMAWFVNISGVALYRVNCFWASPNKWSCFAALYPKKKKE